MGFVILPLLTFKDPAETHREIPKKKEFKWGLCKKKEENFRCQFDFSFFSQSST